jgi:hypothetical protein
VDDNYRDFTPDYTCLVTRYDTCYDTRYADIHMGAPNIGPNIFSYIANN